jgi:integrase
MTTDFVPAPPVPWGVPPQPWHPEVEAALLRRYKAQGWSTKSFVNSWALLRRICGPLHPAEVTIRELEEVVLRVAKQGSRVTYVSQIRSIFNSLRVLGVIPADHRPDDALPRLRRPRSVPRPISKEQADYLLATATGIYAEWFTLGIFGGLRAVEVSRLEGSWLEMASEGPTLRIFGKGNTDLTIPAHPRVVEVIQSHRTLGRLYPITPAKLASKASAEMRRILGVQTSYHALRHTFATSLLEASGGDLLLVSELLRHGDLSTTRGYAQLKQGRKRTVLDSLTLGGVQGVPTLVAAP